MAEENHEALHRTYPYDQALLRTALGAWITQLIQNQRGRSSMLGQLGAMELLLILVIVLLVFGVDRVGKVGRELGEGIRGFREGMAGETPDAEKPETDDQAV